MHDYRVYQLDGADKITAAHWVQSRTLDEAIGYITNNLGNAAFEIWEGAKCRARVPRRTVQLQQVIQAA
jgi:hypothetical protein